MKKYFSILTDMENRISEGHYASGQRLPSVRSAAALYQCSVSTITRAYAELEKRHVIYSVPQSGFYTVEKPGEWRDKREHHLIDFATVLPDLDAFPYLDFQHCLNKAIDIFKYDLFTYGEAHGLSSLRQTLVSHLANDQVFTKAQQIIIVPGVQQALEIMAKMPFPNGGTTILVEQPSYDLFLRFLEREGLAVKGIVRDASGINLEALEDLFKSGDIKFFYTMSRYHNPLGTSLSVEERKAIVRLANKYDVFILEDDYMSDLGEERQFDPLYACDSGQQVVYLKSFSKIIFPGLRVGAVVLPERLLDIFCTYKVYPDTSLLSQATLEIYIKNGMYDRHKHKISSLYALRMQALHKSLSPYSRSGLVVAPDIKSGIYTHIKLGPTVNLERLIKHLAKRGIRVVSSKDFYLTNYLNRDKFLRISISQAEPEQIDSGIQGILEAVIQCHGAK